MVKGLYTAYTGMRNEMRRMDILANNLANSDTYGFKKEGTTSRSFDEEMAVKLKDTSVYGLNQRIGDITYGVNSVRITQTGLREAIRSQTIILIWL